MDFFKALLLSKMGGDYAKGRFLDADPITIAFADKVLSGAGREVEPAYVGTAIVGTAKVVRR